MRSKKIDSQLIGWFICSIGVIFYSYEYFLRISPSVMQNALEAHFQITDGGYGLLSSFYYYAYVPMQIPVGILMDRYGPRRLLTLACLICAVGTYVFACSESFAIAAVGRFMVGLGSSFAFVGVLKLATLWLPEDKLAMVSGTAAALGALGAVVGDNLLGWMVLELGWQLTVNLTAVMGVFLTIIMWFTIKDKPHNGSGLAADKGTIDSFSTGLTQLWSIAKSKQIWINGMYGGLVYLPTTVFAELWGIPYLRHAYHMSQGTADFANSLLFIGFIVGAPIMGALSDYIHRRKPVMILGASGALFFSLLIFYVSGWSLIQTYVLLFLLGMFYSSQAIVFAVGRESSPENAAGMAMAMTNMVVMLGGMFLQPVIGWLLDWRLKVNNPGLDVSQIINKLDLTAAADYQLAMTVVPIGIAVSLVLAFCVKETHAHAR